MSQAANIGRGQGLAEDRLVVAASGTSLSLGGYVVTLIKSKHSTPDRWPGVITEPVVPPVNPSTYRCGEAWSTLVHHGATGRRLLIQGSAGSVPGALAGQRANVVYLGVAQLGMLPEPDGYIADYWTETVRAVGARRVVLIHWDDLFRPLDEPILAAPYTFDDLNVSMPILTRLATDDDVSLHLPTVWQRTDPWL